MAIIEIRDGPGVNLGELLDLVQRDNELHWTVMEIWATGQDDSIDVAAIERQAAASPHGLTMSAAELRDFAGRLLQIIDGIVVGYRHRHPDRGDPDLRSTAEIVIEAIDSTLWRVYARDRAVIDRVRHAYDDVREVAPEVPIPPVHKMS